MKRYISVSLAILCILLTTPSCGRQRYLSHTTWGMDTLVTIKIDKNTPDAELIFSECDAILSSLDSLMSRTNPESEVSRVNAVAGSAEVSAHTAAIIRTALEVSELTGGSFDITVLPYVLMWERGAENKLPDPGYIKEPGDAVGYEKISLDGNTVKKSNENTRIDLGAIVKDTPVTGLSNILSRPGKYGLVSFGSNVAVIGEKPDGSEYRIGKGLRPTPAG